MLEINAHKLNAFYEDLNIDLTNTANRAIESTSEYLRSASYFELLRDFAFIYLVSSVLRRCEDSLLKYGLVASIGRLAALIWKRVFDALVYPILKVAAGSKLKKASQKIEKQLIVHDPSIAVHSTLPQAGLSVSEIRLLTSKFAKLKRAKWADGMASGTVYHGGKELLQLQSEVYSLYTVTNQLHPDCFPEIRQMEAEIVSMVLDLFNGPPGSCGTTTSGGTESLLLTCLAAKERARRERGLDRFEIIAPITVHAGIDKACAYFGMTLIHAPLDKNTYQVDLKAVNRFVGPNTVLIVGSAPNYPHGIIDDIQGLSDIALKYGIPLHVDACLGSFIVPMLHEFIAEAPLFDFRVAGVTSISCDTHKYGYAPKGSSVIMYRSRNLRRYQYFVCNEWTGGIYATPTLAGSRPGALMAGCWATLLHIGKDGYRTCAKEILDATREITKALRQDPLLNTVFEVIGDPICSVVAFRSDKISVYDFSDAMAKDGWHLSTLKNPPALHIAVTRLTLKVVPELISSLKENAKALISAGSTRDAAGTHALYGMSGSVHTAGLVDELVEGFLDTLYSL